MDKILSLLFYMMLGLVTAYVMGYAQKKNEKKWIWIPIIILTLVAGFRAIGVGVDTKHNVRIFYSIYENGFKFVKKEYGFYTIVSILMNLFQNTTMLFLVFSFIIYTLFFNRMWDFKDTIDLRIAGLVFVLNYFGSTLNGMRQFIAIAIIFYGTRYLEKKKIIFFLISILIAMQFHISAIISIAFVPFYIDFQQIKEKYTKEQILKILGITIFFIIFIIIFIFIRYSHYFDNFKKINLGIMIWVRLLLVIGSFVYGKKLLLLNKESDLLFKHFFRITLFGILFGFGNMFLDFSSRVGYYFKVFEIVYYAYLFKIVNFKIEYKRILLYVLVLLGAYNYKAYNGVLPYHTIFSKKANIINEGMCGSNVKWSLDKNGVLKISGEGKMTSYYSSVDIPWQESRYSIKKIEIGKDITGIGVYAFKGAVNCKEIIFEEGSQIDYIAGSSFNYLEKLKELKIPETVTTIGNYSFANCQKLEKVYLPSLVGKINDNAFDNCDKEKLVFSVAKGSYAENYAKEHGFNYETRGEENMPISSGKCGDNINWELYSNGVLKLNGSGEMEDYQSNGDTPWYNYRHSIKTIEIGKGISSIGVYAFKGAINCTSIIFEEQSSLKDINGSTFVYLQNLEEIILPEPITKIGNYTFGYCKNLKKVYLPKSITKINDTAFNNCDKNNLVLEVAKDSYAENYAKEQGYKYITYE